MSSNLSNDIQKGKVVSRYRFQAEKELRNMSDFSTYKMKSIKINGKSLTKEKLLDLYSSVTKKTKRDLSLGDLAQHLDHKERYGIKIEYKDKQKILSLARERAEKNMRNAPSVVSTSSASRTSPAYDRKVESIPNRYTGQKNNNALDGKASPTKQNPVNTPLVRTSPSSFRQAPGKGFSSLYSTGVMGVPGGRMGHSGGRPFGL